MLDLNGSQGLLDSLTAWCQTRNWDLYKFSSPLVALFIQIFSKVFKKKLASAHNRKVEDLGVTDAGVREQIFYVTKDWDLKVSYFATAISAPFSILAITRAFSGGLRFPIVIAIVCVPFLLALIFVMVAEFGTLSLPLASGAKRDGRFKAWLYQRKWTYAEFYSYLLMTVNILLLILVFLSMPPKA
jgi:hypothetical protein